MALQISMTIAGEAVESATRIDVENPATGLAMASVPVIDPPDLERCVVAAGNAVGDWSSDLERRRWSLRSAATAVEEAASTLARVLTQEQGKTLAEAQAELSMATYWLRYYADLELPEEDPTVTRSGKAFVTRRPLGVVAVVSPWNYPVFLGIWKVAAALLAGNSVIWKPSPLTPVTSLMVGRVVASFFPPGVLNVISGDHDLGPQLTRHPGVHAINFTGSTATGRAIAGDALTSFKRVTLEMGGNDAAIVLDDDLDIAKVAERLFWSAFLNAGQACVAIKRLYVPTRRYADMVSALEGVAASVSVGEGLSDGVQMGPVASAEQERRMHTFLEDATGRGARAFIGGNVLSDLPAGGHYCRPVVVAGASHGMRVVDEEQFTPILPVIKYDHLEQAVHDANTGPYGLGASVWGSDVDKAVQVSTLLEAGSTWVNTHAELSPRRPFGGLRESGLGVENGQWGVDEMSSVRSTYVSMK